MFFLRIIANVIFPALAGFVVTLHLILPLWLSWQPEIVPSAFVMIPVTGAITWALSLVFLGARRRFGRADL